MRSNNPQRTKGDIHIPEGLLAAPQIYYCLIKHEILRNYKKECIQPATYDMRLGEKALRWEGIEKKEFDVKKDKSIILPPNSVTFVTTVEIFNLPNDIVARFNLKSKLVHRGLLLGTGPMVDPGFKSRLAIPIHNFSNQPVEIFYKEAFISVEFTKSCNPYEICINSLPVKTKFNTKGEIPVEEFFQKTFLTGSSVMQAVKESKQQQKETEKLVEQVRKIGLIAIVGALVGIFSLLMAMFDTLSSHIEKINNSISIVNDMRHEMNSLQKELKELKQEKYIHHQSIFLNS